jgi:glycosyltransferase involved in cell wall biosynthesis
MTENFATPSLTVILPVRCAAERMDAIARLSYLLHDTRRPASLEILVVDDGSPIRLSEQLQKECKTLGYRYHRIASESETFSIGRARNIGTPCHVPRY